MAKSKPKSVAAKKKKTTKKTSSKKAAKKKQAKKKGPTELELWLHAPGMDSLLRAGVGGLASVLESLESQNPRRVKLPGAPWKNKQPQHVPE